MKKKHFLLGITLLASATLLIACQSKPNSTTSVEKAQLKRPQAKQMTILYQKKNARET